MKKVLSKSVSVLALIAAVPTFTSGCTTASLNSSSRIASSEEIAERGLASSDVKTVTDWKLRLPPALARLFADKRVIVRAEEDFRRIPKRARKTDKGFLLWFEMGKFKVATLRGASQSDIREAVAEGVMWEALQDDLDHQLAHATLLMLPKDPGSKVAPIERMAHIGRAQMSGKKSSGDEIGDLWWRLRFEPTNRYDAISPDTRVMLVSKTYTQGGYGPKEDYGHSALGWMSLRDLPSEDVAINPGAKSTQVLDQGGGHNETTLPTFHSPEKLNEIRLRPYWDWIETQVTVRGLSADILVFQLNSDQSRAMELIATLGDGLSWGEAGKYDNNCAHGARQIFNALLPVDREINVGFPTVPDKFPELLADRFRQVHFIQIKEPAEYDGVRGKLSDIVHFDNPKDIRTFKEVKIWRDEFRRSKGLR